jgi:hypothetical protein
VLARAIDPVVQEFIGCATSRGLSVWMPNRLEDIEWAWHQTEEASFVEVLDRRTGDVWTDETLAGVWYRDLPESSVSAGLDVADARYAAEEANSSLVAAWLRCRCPVVGLMSSLDTGLADAGLEVRVELRRRRLNTVADHVGTLAHITATTEDDPHDVWITGAGQSGWLDELITTGSARSDGHAEDIVAASPIRDRARCAAIFIDSHLREAALEMTSDGAPSSEEVAPVIDEMKRATQLRVGVVYFARSDAGWSVVKISPHIPGWLDPPATGWVAAHLCDLFGPPSVQANEAASKAHV